MFFCVPPPPVQYDAAPLCRKFISINLFQCLTKCFVLRILKAGLRVPACAYVVIRMEFPVEKEESYAGFALKVEFQEDYSVVDIYMYLPVIIYFDKLKHYLFYKCIVLQKYGIF